MKTKLFMLLTMMIVSMGAFAQSNEPLEGDVNKDGKVDVADIVKVIDIMAAAEQPQTTVYYWYVGTEKPTESTNPEINIDNEGSNYSTGWTRLTEKPNQIKIFKETEGWYDVQWYLAAPAEWGFVTSFNGIQVGGWTKTTISINGVLYNVWTAQALTDTVNVTLANV